ALNLFSRNKTEVGKRSNPRRNPNPRSNAQPPAPLDFESAPREAHEADPLKRLIRQGRHAIILREETKWRDHPGSHAAIAEAQRALERRMAIVPAGNVAISSTVTAQPGGPEEDIEVEAFLLDVHCVTNARYQHFVDDEGYDNLDLWPEEIWPHLIELKDSTDDPGPRFWRHARHDTRLADHPIVGVSWFEAQAFALWSGQRLATEAEWQMASSWHINSSADLLRRFPWGDAMDNKRCNVWSSRRNGTVPVDEYPNGAAPNQVLQLVGNVWEWTNQVYSITDDGGRPIVGEMPMHVIRGGAFDTYFETQTTSHFRTGQIALARTQNTGIRCAMDIQEAAWINGE
ncbi:MAG: SUMF1/EgtB/PvdO family nonheme iron enzyme, partial [Planctomycetes bacterium]|nr:SUMF1/EgtB/PvdO family nonheme iron enzyme [Planctomycetota bacterium]